MEQNDEQFSSMYEANLADLFAEAAARAEAGEAIDAILASAPLNYQDELAAMLNIGMRAMDQRFLPTPPRDEARRAAARAAFLQAAAELRAEQMAVAGRPAAGALPIPAHTPRISPASSSVRIALSRLWARFQQATTIQTYRFAPLIVTLVIVAIAALSIVRVTQAAAPGDVTYPVKNWARAAGLVLTPPEARAELEQRIRQEIVAEIGVAAQRQQQTASEVKDLNDLIIETTLYLPFQGYQRGQLLLGDMVVFPSYQPDANALDRKEMVIEGDLREGALVKVTVRILPGQTQYVQGVRAEVIAPPPQGATSPQGETGAQSPVAATATPGPRRTPPCTPTRPARWIPYTVQRGDTIAALAAQRGVALSTVTMYNCIFSDLIVAGATIYLPPTALAPTETAPTSTPLPPTLLPSPTNTPSGESSPTPDGDVTATPPTPGAGTSTSTPEDTPTLEATPTSDGGTQTPTTEASPTPEATATDNATLTNTPAATPTVVVTETPTSQAVDTPTTETTPAATEAAAEATPTESTGPPTTAPPASPTEAAIDTPTPTPVPAPATASAPAAPTVDPVPPGAGSASGVGSAETVPAQPAPAEPAPNPPVQDTPDAGD